MQAGWKGEGEVARLSAEQWEKARAEYEVRGVSLSAVAERFGRKEAAMTSEHDVLTSREHVLFRMGEIFAKIAFKRGKNSKTMSSTPKGINAHPRPRTARKKGISGNREHPV